MANDRLFIVCNGCETALGVASYWPQPDHRRVYAAGDNFVRFFLEHIRTCWPKGAQNLAGIPGFSFTTEDLIDTGSPLFLEDRTFFPCTDRDD